MYVLKISFSVSPNLSFERREVDLDQISKTYPSADPEGQSKCPSRFESCKQTRQPRPGRPGLPKYFPIEMVRHDRRVPKRTEKYCSAKFLLTFLTHSQRNDDGVGGNQ